MSSLSLRAGISSAIRLPSSALIIVGQNRHFQNLKFEEISQKFEGVVDRNLWIRALEVLPNGGSLPLHLNQIRLISISEKVSRSNTPSNALSIFKDLKGFTPPKGCTTLGITLIVDYDHVVASVAAIARSFPLYTRKTNQENVLQSIEVEVVVMDGKELSMEDVQFLSNLSSSIRETARLIDAPANELTTDALVSEALEVAKTLNVKTLLIKDNELLEKGFGGIYHVGKAGPTPPAFVVLSHTPEGATNTVALVGKGVVYDTGGMQIKGKTGMPNMKRDMGGAAGMLHAFSTLVKSGYKQNLHACLCIVENHVSPIANKPDDIITMLSGKTVEINNTDAEGRLILADGVVFAKNELKADTIIDMATLTGAQSYLSGKLHAAVLTNNEDWEAKVVLAGRRAGDLVAPMVFAPDLHFPDLKSPVADMRNSNLGKMEGPPSAVAGLFIGSHIDFGDGLNWIHLDIAAPAENGDRATGYGPALISTLLGSCTPVPLLQ